MKKYLFLIVLCILPMGCAKKDTCEQNLSPNEQSMMDSEITTKVKSEILVDGSLTVSGRFVNVITNNRVVTLTGTVPTMGDRDKIYYIAAKVKCVVKVDNQIKIEKQK